jgi:hypothetical protein
MLTLLAATSHCTSSHTAHMLAEIWTLQPKHIASASLPELQHLLQRLWLPQKSQAALASLCTTCAVTCTTCAAIDCVAIHRRRAAAVVPARPRQGDGGKAHTQLISSMASAVQQLHETLNFAKSRVRDRHCLPPPIHRMHTNKLLASFAPQNLNRPLFL